ncbi:hypothetical protein FGSG_11331 [Fusarium graminearum PH-1]|uniref:hypothetical protein n=1 Tax=Gibberella zeae (strain ATCC MYA-4620 / CBS 123657 / FGSC 9075 / NRRL 31084 / PH-1) TaxID=229533 RepID=UPI000023EB9C|nr:hypothetical protein FGSG_11331 [Fusarium graminearum PH-1]ESU18291.1 hypothetical protein FGSG_11331 [Fusarium graminearum PH-1]|eukprot:XP_011325913.1 hypothetical protein FGSG_11331 [Fusarium graminearum PH-1]
MTTINAHVHMEPDDNPVEIESSEVQDNSSSTDSLRDSIFDFRRENGRTYHKYKEGINTISVSLRVQSAQRYRRTPAIGLLALTCRLFSQAFDSVPANVQFELDDIDEDWTYSEPFDFVHSRFMNFSVQNWKSYLTKIYENLTPGGYVELQDVDVIMGSDDGTLKPDTTMYKWCQLLDEAAGTFNRSFERTTNFKTLLQEIGFVEVVETRYKWPTNGWPRDKKYKELGHWNNANASSALEALTMAPFTRGLGWSREEVESFLVALKIDWNNPKIHAYWPICVTYAKKPEA